MRAPRILIAKPGLDGHDVGAKVICLALRNAGFEVLYSGLRRTPEEIAAIALQEDVDAVGLSILSGAHLPLCQAVARRLAASGLAGRPWIVGGNIPERDWPALRDLGAAAVLPTGSTLAAVIRAFREATGTHPEDQR